MRRIAAIVAALFGVAIAIAAPVFADTGSSDDERSHLCGQ